MQAHIFQKIEKIFHRQKALSQLDFEESRGPQSLNSALEQIVETETAAEPIDVKTRIQDELIGFGPLRVLLDDEGITEILVNSFSKIYFEKNGVLIQHVDHFFSEGSYLALIDRLSQQAHTYMNREKPFVEVQIENWRVTMIFSEVARGHCLLSIRKQPKSLWSLSQFRELSWCNDAQLNLVYRLFAERKNFLVVGGTGSGKTSFLQALLQELPLLERAVMIEDTQELHPPNGTSVSLLTRTDPSRSVADVTMDDLLKRALRLRPDRLVVGEIRGPEAKSLLMAMATGHDGSFGSMHARTASEALLRLEMLVQMGAPQWNLQSIRRLLAMTVQIIFVVEKHEGRRRLQGIYQLSSLEETGITLLQLDEG